jgi:hypothetical protein
MQGSLFALLNYVIGGGREDVQVSLGTRLARLDTVFGRADGGKLVVEYDGAYWHRGREEQDFLKARRVMSWYGPGCVMVRVREHPLEATRDGDYVSPDVQVPARVDAGTCARLVLLHLIHVRAFFLTDWKAEDRILDFLRSAAEPLERGNVLCETCREVADHFRLPITDAVSA